MAAAASIVLVAGGLTFVNEWYNAHDLNWKVPIATALGAAVIDGIATINPHAGTALAIMVLIAASTTRLKGKSPLDTVSEMFAEKKKPKHPQRDLAV